MRVFTVELVKGSKPASVCRLVDDHSFVGSRPNGAKYSDGFHRYIRVMTLQEVADFLNPQIAAGTATVPLTVYVDSI